MGTTEMIELLVQEKKKAEEAGNDRLVRVYNYVIRLLNRQQVIDKLIDLRGSKNE